MPYAKHPGPADRRDTPREGCVPPPAARDGPDRDMRQSAVAERRFSPDSARCGQGAATAQASGERNARSAFQEISLRNRSSHPADPFPDRAESAPLNRATSARPTGFIPLDETMADRRNFAEFLQDSGVNTPDFHPNSQFLRRISAEIRRFLKLSSKTNPLVNSLFTKGSISSGRQDSNLRPSAPKADTLTGLRYTPNSSALPPTSSENKKADYLLRAVCRFVGETGFEPATSNSRSWRANRTALHPEQMPLSF